MSQHLYSSSPVFSPDEYIVNALKLHVKKTQKPVIIQHAPCPQYNMAKLVIVMVGLPARGKSYIAKLLTRYLNWVGVNAKVFNVGEYRRQILGPGQSFEFWDPENKEYLEQRKQCSITALDDLITYLQDGGQCAIFDATNTTKERREMILKHLTDEKTGLDISKDRILFIESICQDEKIISANVREMKVKSNDYKGYDSEQAFQDFLQRIKQYEAVYQPLDQEADESLSYMKLIDVGKKLILNRISGYVPGRIVSLLMNVHIVPRKIYLCRHGESEYNVLDKVGGDSSLSPKGSCFAPVLAEFVKQLKSPNLIVWTSTMQRTIQTASQLVGYPTLQYKALEEISVGTFDGLSYAEIEKQYPHDHQRRKQDKYRYRYPRGESYEDLVFRTEPVIIELERQRCPLLIVSHNAVTRVLYAYLTGMNPEQCTDLPIPLHTIIEITPSAYGIAEKRYDLDSLVTAEYERRLRASAPKPEDQFVYEV